MEAKAIGQRLRNIRQEHNLTIRAVAEMIKVSELYWGQVEAGKTLPSIESLSAFLNIFEESADYILFNKRKETTPLPKNDLIELLSSLNQHDLKIAVEILETYKNEEQNTLSDTGYFNQHDFAYRLRKFREKIHLTLQELTQKTGLSRGHIQQIELYGTIPTLKTLDKMATAMNMPIDWVLANSIPAGKHIVLQEAVDNFQQLTPEQQKIAISILKGYLNGIQDEKKNDE